MTPEMHPVASSAIESIGYDEDSATLAITFTGGATYLYAQVPHDIYDRLMAADSKGTFVNRVIKPAFPATSQ